MKIDIKQLKDLNKGDMVVINSEKYEVEDLDAGEIHLMKEGDIGYSGVKFVLKYEEKRDVKFVKISDSTGGRFGALHIKKFGGKIAYPEYEEVEIKNFEKF